MGLRSDAHPAGLGKCAIQENELHTTTISTEDILLHVQKCAIIYFSENVQYNQNNYPN